MITLPCPICERLDTVKAYSCCHEDTCSVDYTVQCLGECIKNRGELGYYSPKLLWHAETEKEAIAAWNKGEIEVESRIYCSGGRYMGD